MRIGKNELAILKYLVKHSGTTRRKDFNRTVFGTQHLSNSQRARVSQALHTLMKKGLVEMVWENWGHPALLNKNAITLALDGDIQIKADRQPYFERTYHLTDKGYDECRKRGILKEE